MMMVLSYTPILPYRTSDCFKYLTGKHTHILRRFFLPSVAYPSSADSHRNFITKTTRMIETAKEQGGPSRE